MTELRPGDYIPTIPDLPDSPPAKSTIEACKEFRESVLALRREILAGFMRLVDGITKHW